MVCRKKGLYSQKHARISLSSFQLSFLSKQHHASHLGTPEGGSHCNGSHKQAAGARQRGTPRAGGGGEPSTSGNDDTYFAANVKDWREFRARLVRSGMSVADPETSLKESGDSRSSSSSSTSSSDRQSEEGARKSWAHALASPEAGCLVIARPGAFGMNQTYFNQAVIFLFAHGPTEYSLGQLPGFEELLPEFSECPLYMGGDVGSNCTHVVHGVSGLDGSKEIIDGVFVGGYYKLKEHVRTGLSSAMDYRWFARYAGWSPGQLEREVESGVWYLGSCSKDLILKHCSSSDKNLWQEVLQLIDGEYAKE
eukprot:jgi/Mesen1/8866/ME000053S08268